MINSNKQCKFFIHLVIYTVYVCGIYHTIDVILNKNPPSDLIKNGGFFKNITNWNMIIQSTTFTLTLFCDLNACVNRTNAKSSRLFQLRNLLFNSLALPLGLFISTGFWTLYAWDKDLVYRDGMELLTPPWKNHLLHTFPIVINLLDNFLVDHRRREERHGLKLLWSVIICYTSYALFLCYFLDDWVYPYLRHLSHLMRIGFIMIHLLLTTLYYYIGAILYDVAWPTQAKPKNCQIAS